MSYTDLVAAVRIKGVEELPRISGQKNARTVYVAEVIEVLKGDATGTIRFLYPGLLFVDSVNLILAGRVADSAGSGSDKSEVKEQVEWDRSTKYVVSQYPDCATPLIWKETLRRGRVLALPRLPTYEENVWYTARFEDYTEAFATEEDGSILLEDLREKIAEWARNRRK